MAKEWYFAADGAQRGPYSVEDMSGFARSGALAVDTLVWTAGLPDWIAMRDSALSEYLPPAAVSLGKQTSVPSAGEPGIAGEPAIRTAMAAGAAVDDADLGLWPYFVRALTRDAFRYDGRARRKEYGAVVLFSTLILVAGFVALGTIASILESRLPLLFHYAAVLAISVPGLAVLVRRLHDLGVSGWASLALLIPFLGPIAAVIVLFLPSQLRENAYGPPPAGVAV